MISLLRLVRSNRPLLAVFANGVTEEAKSSCIPQTFEGVDLFQSIIEAIHFTQSRYVVPSGLLALTLGGESEGYELGIEWNFLFVTSTYLLVKLPRLSAVILCG
jgi:hypothetical protein